MDDPAARLRRASLLGARQRDVVQLAGARRTHRQPRGVGQDRVVSHVRRERRLVRSRPAADGAGGHPGRVHHRLQFQPARARQRVADARHHRPARPRRPGSRADDLAVQSWRPHSPRRRSTTPLSSSSSPSASGSRSPTSRRGAGRSSAISPRRCFRAGPTPRSPRCPRPLSTCRPAAPARRMTRTPSPVARRRASRPSRRCRSRAAARSPRATTSRSPTPRRRPPTISARPLKLDYPGPQTTKSSYNKLAEQRAWKRREARRGRRASYRLPKVE